jgi:hypothetical protein
MRAVMEAGSAFWHKEIAVRDKYGVTISVLAFLMAQ